MQPKAMKTSTVDRYAYNCKRATRAADVQATTDVHLRTRAGNDSSCANKQAFPTRKQTRPRTPLAHSTRTLKHVESPFEAHCSLGVPMTMQTPYHYDQD